MVQRKVTNGNKLGIIQADRHLKSEEKRFVNLKSSSFQHREGKNIGSDLMKKMKKSRSIRHSNLESFRSPNKRLEAPARSSPNYMKSTSSFAARKECSQVNSRNHQDRSNSKAAAACSQARKYSLKQVSNLTKTPSFKKPVRASAKKSSQVVVQRATCSSILKDSKFPSYLGLNPGATESQGTSVLKVCPYTYCSLNGHPPPPLKCFLSARRRALKTQKSIKLSNEKHTIQESIFETVPLTEDEHPDFFIEIYSKEREEHAGSDIHGNDFPVADGSKPHDVEVETPSIIHLEESDSEASELERETGQDSAPYLDDEVEPNGCTINVRKAHEIVSCCFKEIPAHEMLKEELTEISLRPEEWGINSDPESDGSYQDFESDQSIQPEALTDLQDNDQFLQKDDTDTETDQFNEFTARELIETCKDYENLLPGDKDPPTDANFEEEFITAGSRHDEIEKEQADSTQLLIFIDISNDESQFAVDAGIPTETQDSTPENYLKRNEGTKIQNSSDKVKDKAVSFNTSNSLDSVDQTHSGIYGMGSPAIEVGNETMSEEKETFPLVPEETCSAVKKILTTDKKKTAIQAESNTSHDLLNISKNLRERIRCKRPIEEVDEPKEFNPREPNYLSLEPDPDAEKVDLRNQIIEERKSAEEWMVDYALRQAVTKLAPARKRKVALLVEAFETVTPIPKFQAHLTHNSAVFAHSRQIQACN